MTGVSGRGAGGKELGFAASGFSHVAGTERNSSSRWRQPPRRGKGKTKQLKERTLILRRMQEIRHEAETLKTFSRMESTYRTAEELATLSRRARIRQLGKELGDLYGCLEASSRLKIGWLAEVLQADIPPLIDTLNAQGEALGFRVNRSGDWLSLDVIDNG